MDVAIVATAATSSSVIEALYREHGDRLWRAVLAYSGDADIASDAVHEAFTQALRRGDALTSPLGWVWRTAFRVAAGQLQERSRRGDWPNVEPAYRMVESDDTLLVALARLPTGQRAAVILHYYADLPVQEIARVLGSSSLAVRVNLSRGRARLRTILEPES